MRLLRVCAEPSCHELVRGGYCAIHRTLADARRSERDKAIKARGRFRWVYKSRRWYGLRAQVKREQPWCAVEGCNELTAEIDHIIAMEDGGAPFDRANLSGLCKRHHSRKTAEEVRNRRRAEEGGGDG